MAVSHLDITLHDPRWASLDGDAAALALAYEALWYYAPGYKYDPRFKRGLWDGKVQLIDEGFVPAGLVPRLEQTLSAQGVSVRCQRWPHGNMFKRKPYGFAWNDETPGPLRSYQIEAVAACRREGRGIVQIATGGGKTEVIARLIQEYDTRAIVICNTKDLLHQTAGRLAARIPDVNIGLAGDGYASFGDITVALFQALATNLDALRDELEHVSLVIADEAHHVPSESFDRVMSLIPAPYRFGFTATPYTSDDQYHSRDLVLEGQTGPVIFRYGNQDAIADGVLVQPHVFLVRYQTALVLDPKRNDWSWLHKEGVVKHAARNDALAQLAATVGGEWGKTLVLARELSQVQDLAQRIAGYGIAAPVLHAQLSSVKRRQTLSAFKEDPDVPVLVATGLLDEGVDVPAISAVVLADAGRADHKLLQRIGRGMRRGGQDRVVVIDADDRCHPILKYHTKKRRDLYEREGWQVEEIDV